MINFIFLCRPAMKVTTGLQSFPALFDSDSWCDKIMNCRSVRVWMKQMISQMLN